MKIAKGWPDSLPTTVLVALALPVHPTATVLQIIESYAPVAVGYASSGEIASPKRIYLSPPGQHLFVARGGILMLDAGNPFDTFLPSINRLFSSAASVYGSRVVGVLLSGETKDGAQGLSDIEAAGGVTIVQRPEDAAEPLMPKHALKSDHPRYCVRAAEIAPLVQKLIAG